MKKIIAIIFCMVCSFSLLLSQTTITMERRGGVFYIPGKINGLPLKFIFDTGASDVYISLSEAMFMLKNGYLSYSDFGDVSYSRVANGEIVENTEVLLKEVEIGSVKITNVRAMVSHSLNAPLLLGQSAIQKLGPIQLDGNLLIIQSGKTTIQLYNQAYQAAEAGNYAEAIALSQQALNGTSNPQQRAWIYENMAYAYGCSKDIEKAIDCHHKALGEDLYHEQAAYNLGVDLFEADRIEEALRAFNNFIYRHSSPNHIEFLQAAYAYKGSCHAKLGEIRLAEEAFKKSLRVKESSHPLFGLADLYCNSDRFEEACPLFQKALSYEPDRLSNIERWYQYGECLLRTQQYAKALEAFRKCTHAFSANSGLLKIARNDDEFRKDVAYLASVGYKAELMMARLSNNPQEVLKTYEKLYSIMGDENGIVDFMPLDYLRWYKTLESTSISKSKEVLDLGLKQYPDNPDILFCYSLLLEDKDDLGLDYLKRILCQESSYTPIAFDYATVYNNIAWRLYLSGKSTEALPYATKSVRMNDAHDYSWETLGEIYYSLGYFNLCIEAMTKCIDLGGKFKEAYELRAKSYRKLGNEQKANQDMETVRNLELYR